MAVKSASLSEWNGSVFPGEEVWVLPDGTEETCPNPERRFGDRDSAGAKCEGCLLLHPFA